MTRRSILLLLGHFLPVLAVLTSAAFGSDYTGKVLTPDGKPVEGATVYFAELGGGAAASPSARTDLPTTRTDDAGVFHFPRGNSNGAEFIAAAEGFGLSPGEANGSGPIRIQLRPRTDLTLRFLTADNKPVANLRVSLRNISLPIRMSEGTFNNLSIPAGYRSPWSANTDARGVCAIPGLPQGGWVRLALDDERYAELSIDDGVQLSGRAQTLAQPIHLQPRRSDLRESFIRINRRAGGAGWGARPLERGRV